MVALYRTIPALRHWIAAMGIMGQMEHALQGLKELYLWLDLKKQRADIKHMVYALYCWASQSKNTLNVSSLSILGSGHPFIPSDGTRDTAVRFQIVAFDMDSSRAWPSPPARISAHAFFVTFSPDRRHMATSDRITVQIWAVATGQCVREWKGQTGLVNGVAFSPDGRHIASASSDHTAYIWSTETTKLVLALNGHTDRVRSVAFSSDGFRLASSSDDHTVRLWRVGNGAVLRQLNGHTHPVWFVVFSPDGHRLASASSDRTVRIWDVATGNSLQQLKGHAHWVKSITFSACGRRLASASYDCTVRVWDVETGMALQVLRGHKRVVSSVAFSPDGRHLASASSDHTVCVWDARTSALFQKLRGHKQWVRSIAFSPDGVHLASASDDHTVCLWDVVKGAEAQMSYGYQDSVLSIAFSPDARYLASASNDNTVSIWDTTSGKCIRCRPVGGSGSGWVRMDLKEIIFSVNGEVLILRYRDRSVESVKFASFIGPETDCKFDRHDHNPHPPAPAPFVASPSYPIDLDQNSLCIMQGGTPIRICWFPDYFKPTVPVARHGNIICVGGEEGMIAFIRLDGLTIL